jgi:hypothetical protein
MLKKIAVCLLILLVSCQKYLDKKPDQGLVVPTTLHDLQSMLDFTYQLNQFCPSAGEIASDNFYVSDADWLAADHNTQQNYVWGDDVFNEYDDNDWTDTYQWVLYGNTVLEDVEKIKPSETELASWKNIKGSALFIRAHAFYWLTQEFCEVYNKQTASQDAGIAIRLTSDINAPTVKATVQASYDQIITDLKTAAGLLPLTPEYKTRPSKPAAYALLARTYLAMQDYDNALLYSDSCLQLYNNLIDYNSLSVSAYNPVPQFNDEVIYQCIFIGWSMMYPPVAKVDSNLYASYTEDDLRKTIFYKPNNDGSHSFYGSYNGSDDKFSGIATDEIYLLRAECEARKGRLNDAMKDLNTLLRKRYATGSFHGLVAQNADDALQIILNERRKELVWRGLRWTDLRRLNAEGRFTTTVTRYIDGVLYSLPPNDKRYVFQIPQKVIQLSGIEQNPR